jgi:hypothetical protein
MEEKMTWNTWESGWTPKKCSFCKQRTAIAHGWLFNEPPPACPLEDKRKAIGEVFTHADSEDCVRPQRLGVLLNG